jgi:hypothetical protein
MSVLSLHSTAVMSHLSLTQMSPRCSVSVLDLRSLGIPFLCSHTFPQQEFYFLGQVIKQVRRGKEVVHVQFMAKSF